MGLAKQAWELLMHGETTGKDGSQIVAPGTRTSGSQTGEKWDKEWLED